MTEFVFALQFKGKAHPVEGVEGKLAAKTTAAGQVLRTPEDLMSAMEFGTRVSQAAEMAQAQRLSPVQAHIQKVAKALGVTQEPRDTGASVDADINARIDANPELAQKMAAAFAA